MQVAAPLSPNADRPPLAVGRVLREHQARITSLDFSKDGELLASAGEDERLCVYSCTQGALQKVTLCRKFGADLVRFTHDASSLLVSSRSDVDDSVRYLSMHDHRYLRYFKGHTDRVSSLEMSPKDDSFASASVDGTARVWDLRSTSCSGVLKLPGGGGGDNGASRPVAAFDPQGLVFAVALGDGRTRLFDVRGLQKGPFVTFTPDLGGASSFSCLKFSHDGKLMLLGTTMGRVALLDAFTGDLLRTFSGHANESRQPLECAFAPDAQSVYCGSEDGAIWRWQTQTGAALAPLRAHTAAVGALKFNPTRMILASACAQPAVALWLPC